MLTTKVRAATMLGCLASIVVGASATRGLAADAAPTVPGVLSLPNGMDVVWAQPVGSDANQPKTVNVYVVDNAVGKTISLPAVHGAGGTTVAVQCDWYPGPGTCVYCNDDGDYLNPLAAAKVKGVTVVTASTDAGHVVVNGLDRTKVFTVFLQYPSGTTPSECQQAYTY